MNWSIANSGSAAVRNAGSGWGDSVPKAGQ
jgi:hypothetical protein